MRTTPRWTWRLNNSGVKGKKNTSCSSCTWTASSATQAVNDSSESFSLYFFTTVSGTVPCPWLAGGQCSWGKRRLQRWAQLQGAGSSSEHNASSQDPNSNQENTMILSLLVYKTALTSVIMGARSGFWYSAAFHGHHSFRILLNHVHPEDAHKLPENTTFSLSFREKDKPSEWSVTRLNWVFGLPSSTSTMWAHCI